VPVEGSDALSVFGTPHGWHVIFGGSKEQIAIVIVLDNRNGSFVSLEQNRSLWEQVDGKEQGTDV
jgi:protein-tyrosine phosphatase